MTQKKGFKRAYSVPIQTTEDLLRTPFAVRRFIPLIIALGALLISQPLLWSQASLPSSESAQDIIIILPPPPFPPPNDNFSNAAPVVGNSFSVGSSVWRASREPGEPAHEGYPASQSRWWRWTAPSSGIVQVNVPGNSVSPGQLLTNIVLLAPVYLGFYTGNDLTNLTAVPLLEGSSTNIGTASLRTKTYLFQVAAGETYHLATDCVVPYKFAFSFANLVMAQPTTRTNLPAKQPVTLEFAPFDTNSEIATLQVFAGTNSLPASNLNPLQFQFSPAGELEVPIGAIGTNTSGQLLISLTNNFTFQPLNDNFADAEPVFPNSSGSFSENTELATSESGEPNLVFGQSPTHTVWWRWVSPYNVPTQVRLTSGSSKLAIFKGTDLANLELVVALQTSSLISSPFGLWGYSTASFTPDFGATYYVVGEGIPLLSWDFNQETLVMNSLAAEESVTDLPIYLEAIWRESNAPPSGIDFVLGQPPSPIVYGGQDAVVEIGLAGSVASPPYQITWTPTNYGAYYIWARCTNEFGSLRESPKTSFRIFLPHDNFADAEVIPSHVRSTNFVFNVQGTTTEIGEPPHRNIPAVATRWWKWTPAYSGSVRIKAIRELQAVPLEIFIGNSLNNIRPIASNWQKAYRIGISGALRVPVRAGNTYFIRVDETSPNSHHPTVPESNITLSLEPAANAPRAELLLSLQNNPFTAHWERARPFASVLMPDGTPVYTAGFRAQLYLGTNSASLTAVGPAQPFDDPIYSLPDFYVGVPWPVPVILPDVKAYSPVFAQLRVWDSNAGNSYEAARAAGGLCGKSNVVRLIAGSEDAGPAPLTGLTSFKLHTP
jgi:hypothetical protein